MAMTEGGRHALFPACKLVLSYPEAGLCSCDARRDGVFGLPVPEQKATAALEWTCSVNDYPTSEKQEWANSVAVGHDMETMRPYLVAMVGLVPQK